MTQSSTKHVSPWGRVTLVAAAVATSVIFAAPIIGEVLQTDYLVGSAVAAQQMGGNGGSDQMHQGQGEPGGPGAYHQGQGNLDKVLADDGDDDSDRPDWAGGDKDANPHRGDGNAGGDSKKGGDYGDIWIVLRDDTGLPILDANGNLQPCGDVECTTENLIALTVDGELPPGATPIEVEFGRLNIARSPDSVLEHSLVEALSKLDGLTWDVDVKVDEAGRLTIGDATIDSPLENLAIYEALLTTEAVNGEVTLSVTTTVEGEGDVTYTFTVPESVRLDLAASAIAAASDKTGDLSVEEVINISAFLEAEGDLADLVGSYTYDRTDAYGDVSVTILVETEPGSGIWEEQEVQILTVVEFDELPSIDNDNDGIEIFAQAADDSVHVLEYVHDNAAE